MTTITLNKKNIEKKLGKLDDSLQEKILMAGVEIDSISDTELTIDVTPNRIDLLSEHGFLRYMLNHLGKSKVKKYLVKKPEKDFTVKITKETKDIRPYTSCAIVKNLKLDDEKIKELIDVQEKLHNTLGRKRKKLAIGIYPLEKINLPITFTAKKPTDINFRPLEFPREINGFQILSQHPTGREYGDLLKDKKLFPVFLDAKGQVLSMPPIINSHETGKISIDTKDIFIECSGFNKYYIDKTLNILVSLFSDMGGEVYQMSIINEHEKSKYLSPNLEPEKIEFDVNKINKTLGLGLKKQEIEKLFQKAGIETQGNKALIPAYRIDILHEVDLAEEIAIAYGYENFIPQIPNISTVGEEDKTASLKRKIGNILSGVDLLEASSLHLNVSQDIKKMHHNFTDFIELEESKTENNVLRVDLLTNLLKILSENSDSSYPQKLFESGRVFELIKNKKGKNNSILEKEKLSVVLADEKVNFTEIKRVLDYLFKMLDKKYKLEVCENDNFIKGRVGVVLIEGKKAGCIGEIAPRVLKNWKINVPVSAFEIDLELLN